MTNGTCAMIHQSEFYQSHGKTWSTNGKIWEFMKESYALFYKRGVTGIIQPSQAQPSISGKRPLTQNPALAEALKNLQIALDGLHAALKV